MQHFHEISPLDITDNFIRAIGQEWMLITAGDASRCNTMTASWGFVGQIWGHPAAMVVIRPTRYTRQFVEANERLKYFYGNLIGDKWTEDYFTLSTRVSFMAMGWGQSPRGVKMDEVRPDVLLMDDYDTDEECRNPEIVNNKWNWFEQALFFTRSISAAYHLDGERHCEGLLCLTCR